MNIRNFSNIPALHVRVLYTSHILLYPMREFDSSIPTAMNEARKKLRGARRQNDANDNLTPGLSAMYFI